ncbi:single-stranded-DNA-specific exonuclease RecJ [Thermogemmatispora aurantia]|uniref:Single-stranded-DNA-specific exonuclease RecJ n=1 Tax=Thermogemmatispora aurantia TaxID=2045279 RepID=A0A5J4KH27_9CHLR|nr:single-stranded-DNA-specific exonuclease RecJ [Thermogemmatispora aurantia]GER85579.1 single-stranded-DNA-specific exonuclease RecJ [Thermogemmatispora aurantia]
MESERVSRLSWRVCELLSASQFRRFRAAGIEPLHAQLLYNRGLRTPEEMKAFLEARYEQTPDPLTLIDLPRALERIRRALLAGEHITVYGDFDADGVTATALLMRALRRLKRAEAPLDYYIPSRIDEGCGLNVGALDWLKRQGTSLIITTDCASSDVAQVRYAHETLGIEVIITDHHRPPDELPPAYALVNPWRPDSTYPERVLCGVGVAFKLVQALYRSFGLPREEELALLDLVAIGTIADVAELLGENHTLVRLGLERLNQTTSPGLLALMKSAGLQPGQLRERDVAFVLGPRLNAAGRMEDARLACELLMTDDPAEAQSYAAHLERLNHLRQVQTEELMNLAREEASRHPDDAVVLVSGDNWPEGIIGLVASKLAEEIRRPVLVLSRGKEFSRGSARSREGFNMIAALRGCAHLFERYGGHAQAAGFTIANHYVAELHQHLLSWHDSQGNGAEPALLPIEASASPGEQESAIQLPANTLMVDLVLRRPEYFQYQTYSRIRQLSPFGAANPEPVFKAEKMRLLNYWSSGPAGRNLRVRLGIGNVQVMGTFVRGAAHMSAINGASHVDVIFHIEPAWSPQEGESTREITLKILAIAPSPSA